MCIIIKYLSIEEELAKFTDHWHVMVRSEIRHPRLPSKSAQRRELPAELLAATPTTDVSSLLTPTTREIRDPTSAPAESPKTSPSEQTLSVLSPLQELLPEFG